MKKTPRNRGFIRGRLFLTVMATAAAFAALYYGSKWGREFYKIKMGETCTERMWLIEEAKQKYRKAHGGSSSPRRYSELLPYLPFTGFPMCPWGGEFKHALDLNRPVECSLNGNPKYEPDTPGKNPLRNGYMDLAEGRKATSLVDFLLQKNKQETHKKNPGKNSSLFD
jgi:hypothetical protein